MEETLLKAEEAFQAHLLADHAVPYTIELSSKDKERKITLREPLSGSLVSPPVLPYIER